MTPRAVVTTLLCVNVDTGVAEALVFRAERALWLRVGAYGVSGLMRPHRPS